MADANLSFVSKSLPVSAGDMPMRRDRICDLKSNVAASSYRGSLQASGWLELVAAAGAKRPDRSESGILQHMHPSKLQAETLSIAGEAVLGQNRPERRLS